MQSFVTVRRIYITGSPGAGKDTLGLRVEAATGIPYTDLDWLGFNPDESVMPERQQLINRLAAREAWVAAASYSPEFASLLQRADLVIVLDLPWRIGMWRIVRRYLLALPKRPNVYRSPRRFWMFFWRTRRFYLDKPQAWFDTDGSPRTRAAQLELLEPPAPTPAHPAPDPPPPPHPPPPAPTPRSPAPTQSATPPQSPHAHHSPYPNHTTPPQPPHRCHSPIRSW